MYVHKPMVTSQGHSESFCVLQVSQNVDGFRQNNSWSV